MSLIKITFDSASVTSKQDADLNHFLANKQNGRVAGILGAVTASTSNNFISFTAGYVQVYGRRVYVESGTKISISLDGSAYGYIFISFDLSTNTVSLEKRENVSAYPTLTQEDLMNGGLLYELPIARYTKTASSLQLDTSYTPPLIKSSETIATEKSNEALDIASNRYGSLFQMSYTQKTSTYYRFGDIKTSNASNGIGSVYLGGAVVLFPTNGYKGSSFTVSYYYSGRERTLSVEIHSDGLYLSASDGSEPKYVRVTK